MWIRAWFDMVLMAIANPENAATVGNSLILLIGVLLCVAWRLVRKCGIAKMPKSAILMLAGVAFAALSLAAFHLGHYGMTLAFYFWACTLVMFGIAL